jgi:Uma2 family endonuclease
MSKTQTLAEIPPLVLHLAPVIEVSDQQFFELCQLNRDLRIERTSQGDLVIMPPTGGETGRLSFELTACLDAGYKPMAPGSASPPPRGSRSPTAQHAPRTLPGSCETAGRA